MKKTTINRMLRPQLIALIKSVINDINTIHQSIQEIEGKKQAIDNADDKINSEDGILSKIVATKSEVDEKMDLIREAYDEIYKDNEEENSIKTQLEELIKTLEEDKEKIDNFKKQIWGYDKTKEDGSTEKVDGLFDKINSFHKKQREKYDTLYNKIEAELLSGATTVNLAKVFSEKVDEYKKRTDFWTKSFVVLIILVIIYYSVVTFSSERVTDVKEVFLELSFRSPFLAFTVWLAIFLGNRRAENKKLEESYKHKETMARSFTGYKRSIEELDRDDNELLKKHMDNLLNAISEDSGAFLDSKGEKYPLVDFFEERKEKIDKIISKVTEK